VVRYIGMDVHREFAQLAVVEEGMVRDDGRIGLTPEALREWACTLDAEDHVALEATGNSDAIAALLTPMVGRVVVSNPSKTRAIAEAKVKTDKVDARILAQLLAADFLPPVWLPDERTRALRRQVTRRAHLVRARTRIKNQVHAILARNLCPTPPVSDLFGRTGRHWLSRQDLPLDEAATVNAVPAAAGLPRHRAGHRRPRAGARRARVGRLGLSQEPISQHGRASRCCGALNTSRQSVARG
jgi:transposase